MWTLSITNECDTVTNEYGNLQEAMVDAMLYADDEQVALEWRGNTRAGFVAVLTDDGTPITSITMELTYSN